MFSLRPLTIVDGQTLANIHSMCFSDAWSCQTFDNLLAQNTTCGWLVKSQDAQAIGFILARVVEDEGEILTFGVQPAFQRKGLGRSLLRQLLDFLASIGCRTIFLEVAINNEAAIYLYKTIGFEVNGTRPNYYQRTDQPPISAYIMAYHPAPKR